MQEVLAKTTVFTFLGALINYSDPATFGAAVTGALVYYVLFADRGKWVNIVLFLISIPLALHITPSVTAAYPTVKSSGVALFSGAVGLMVIEKVAVYIRSPSAFVRTLREIKAVFRKTSRDCDHE